MGAYHAQEHRERIDGRIGHCRRIVTGRLVGIGQGGRIGGRTGHEAHEHTIVEFEVPAPYQRDHKQRQDGDEETIEHPPGATGRLSILGDAFTLSKSP